MELFVVIVVIIVCVILEGFFSGTEMAFVHADKYRLALATDAGSARALMALHMVKRPAKFFSTTLLGTNLSAITATVVATRYIIDNFGVEYSPLAIIVWPFTFVFGEIVPKGIYQHHADKIVLTVAPILFGFSVILYPAVWLLSKFTDVLLGSIKKQVADSTPLSREELSLMLEVGDPSLSDVRPEEKTLISRIFDLADKRVENIMTPLVDVIALPSDTLIDDAWKIFEEHGFTRLPVYERRVFNVIGVLTGTDLIFASGTGGIRELMKPAYFVPEEMPLDELLISMKKMGHAIAVAVDEYGAATGIVTVEDLLEEVVGEIRDEHDSKPVLYKRVSKTHFVISGRCEVEYANEKLKLGIPKDDYETVAGFVIKSFEYIPKEGEKFTSGQFEYTVTRANDRAVLEVEAVKIN